tara:strand:- start:35 stop:229 length:195 start_codon:yes stop_codon:yes gene_type:complete
MKIKMLGWSKWLDERQYSQASVAIEKFIDANKPKNLLTLNSLNDLNINKQAKQFKMEVNKKDPV